MEMMIVKDEQYQGRRRMCPADGEVQAVRCVKRRRRDPASFAVGCHYNQGQQPQQQNDQTTVATTVKRSSRFRGVSRCKEDLSSTLRLFQLPFIYFYMANFYPYENEQA